MADKQFLIFCDESEANGRYFSNFYGGLLVGSSQYQRVTKKLHKLKASLNLHGEVKWSKVTGPYLEKYEALVRCLFHELRQGHLKMRIMFRQNTHVATGLTDDQIEGSYFRLYYQFIKHAFGFQHRGEESSRASLRLFFDSFPATREEAQQFKGFIHGLGQSPEFRAGNVYLKAEDIAEVRSHEHVLLQMLDIVLGSVNFRLNNLHKEKPPGSRRRGKRTVAKEKLYKLILSEIHTLYPRLNIGISTGTPGGTHQRWGHAYRHWRFIPSAFRYDGTLSKKGGPAQPT